MLQLGGENCESERVGIIFIREGKPQAKQSQIRALVVRAVCLSESSLSMGVTQASSAP